MNRPRIWNVIHALLVGVLTGCQSPTTPSEGPETKVSLDLVRTTAGRNGMPGIRLTDGVVTSATEDEVGIDPSENPGFVHAVLAPTGKTANAVADLMVETHGSVTIFSKVDDHTTSQLQFDVADESPHLELVKDVAKETELSARHISIRRVEAHHLVVEMTEVLVSPEQTPPKMRCDTLVFHVASNQR